MSNSHKICKHCEHAALSIESDGNCDEEDVYECKRFPPVVVTVSAFETVCLYPELTALDWCGEWKQAELIEV